MWLNTSWFRRSKTPREPLRLVIADHNDAPLVMPFGTSFNTWERKHEAQRDRRDARLAREQRAADMGKSDG